MTDFNSWMMTAEILRTTHQEACDFNATTGLNSYRLDSGPGSFLAI